LRVAGIANITILQRGIEQLAMEHFLDMINHLQHWQIALLSTGLLFQGLFFSIFPEEVITTSLGFLWSQGKIGFFEAWISVILGVLPANAITAAVGMRFGFGVLKRRPFRWFLAEHSLREAFEQIRKHGERIVFLARFIPLIRGPFYLSAGICQMGMARFMMTDFLASCVQVPGLLLLGATIGKNTSSALDAYRKIGMLVILLLMLTVGIQFLKREYHSG
jgi:membrane protein DedA with SNARE-associated domain